MPIKGENILCPNHLSENCFGSNGWYLEALLSSQLVTSSWRLLLVINPRNYMVNKIGNDAYTLFANLLGRTRLLLAINPHKKKQKQQHDPDGNGEDGDTAAPDPNDSGNPATRMFEAVMAAMANEPDHPGDAMVALVEQGPRPFEPDRKPKPKNWLPIVLNADEPDTKPKPKNWLPIDLIADLMTINPC